MSFLTSTGLLPNKVDNYLILEQFEPLLFILILLTICGSFSGFAGGGFKINNITLMFIEIKEELNKFVFQHNIKNLNIKKSGFKQSEVNTTYALFATGIFLILICILCHTLNGFSIKDGFIYSLAALTNTGEGLLIISNTNRYCDESLYFILNFLMLCGRFENIGYLLIAKKILFKN